MGEPQTVGDTGEHLVSRIEGIMQKRRAQSEVLREAWEAGDLTKPDLPCFDGCQGDIVAFVRGERIVGRCPVYMTEPYCPLVTLHEREIASRMSRAGFGKHYHNPDTTKIRAMEPVSEFLAHLRVNIQQGRGLIFAGDVGVGKTMTLAYLAKQMLEENFGVWKVHMPELVEALSDRATRHATVQRAIRVQVLMIDDLGSGDMPTWVLGILEGVVEHRYGNSRSVIVTTNLDRAMLTRAPEFRRMVDRWREKNRYVQIGGESMRHGPDKG